MNEPRRVYTAHQFRRGWMSFGKSVSIRHLPILLFAYLALLASDSAVGADSYETSTYVCIAEESSIVQAGGVAGIHRTYTLAGQFQLSIDPNTTTAAFVRVEANAVNDSDPSLTLDPNEVFNLTALTGTLTAMGGYVFDGQTADGSRVYLALTFKADSAYLIGQTTPPPGSADFFVFSIDATAQRKYGGGTGEPNNPYQIWTPEEMNAIGANPDDWDKHFKLMADIDLSGYTAEQFNVIGRDFPQIPPFSGSFDGNRHRIHNFTYRTSRPDSVGLFGYVCSPLRFAGPTAVRNLVLVGPNVEAPNAYGVAALVGQLFNGTISGCYVEGGRVLGGSAVGGLVGYTTETNMATERMIVDCRVSCQVSGAEGVGGLAGVSDMVGVLRCRSSGTVTGGQDVGGLIGTSGFAQISDCYSSSRVIGEDDTGGLVGRSQGDAITACATWGSVHGQGNTGGLVGSAVYSAIRNCYSVASASGLSWVGGLVGVNQGTVSKCCAAGPVSGKSDLGGLIGTLNADPFYPDGTATDSFWDIEASGQTTSGGGTGKTTAEMQTAGTFLDAGWDFVGETVNGADDVWWIDEGRSYPRLSWEPGKYGGGRGKPNDPYLIFTAEQMNAIGANSDDWDKDFKLMADIDLGCYRGMEFNRIGYQNFGSRTLISMPYCGVFDGNGHTILNFTCNGNWRVGVGIFACVEGPRAAIRNLTVIDPNVNVEQDWHVGSLVGHLERGTVVNCHVSGGEVTGGDYAVGALVGRSEGTISNCSVLGTTVSGESNVGGLLGLNNGVGVWYGPGTVTESWACSSVTGFKTVGGLVGSNSGRISVCQSAGEASGTENIGGLAGLNGMSQFLDEGEWVEGRIENSYSTCAVAGSAAAGGLVGYNDVGVIQECYSIGPVGGEETAGGLVGLNEHGEAINCFWDIETSGLAASAGGEDLTTAEMQTAATFLGAGWDLVGETANGIDDIWWIDDGVDYPRLWWELREQ